MTHWMILLVLFGSPLAFGGLVEGPHGAAGDSQTSSSVLSAHRPQEARSIPEPLPLPVGADAVVPMSFTTVTVRTDKHGAPHVLTQQVTRTSDRLRLIPNGSNKEWLFERNPVDPRRVSGYLTDHSARQILVYQESDLRNRQQFRGWADVLMMRFDLQQLAGLRRTDESSTIGGVNTVRYVGPSDVDGIAEVVWSERLLLPLHLTIRRSGVVTTSRIERLAAVVEVAQLTDPRSRFPEYDVLDIADAGDHRP
jgi:hypothetical protein